MKLTEAIEFNEEVVRSLKQGKRPDHADAVQIGIEAINREQYHRSCYPNQHSDLLPGETPSADSP